MDSRINATALSDFEGVEEVFYPGEIEARNDARFRNKLGLAKPWGA